MGWDDQERIDRYVQLCLDAHAAQLDEELDSITDLLDELWDDMTDGERELAGSAAYAAVWGE